MHKPLKEDEWKQLKKHFRNYDFISIENRNSEPKNAQYIGKETNAFLADVNIQFQKELSKEYAFDDSIVIRNSQEWNQEILDLANFEYSKFIEDPEFKKRNGNDVYQHWIINSFEKPNKFFAIYKEEDDNTLGFLLHSYSEDRCVIELIAVKEDVSKRGIGTKLIQIVESEAKKNGKQFVKVGTQLRNIGAINFYQKNEYRQIEFHQVYHLWSV
jgi:ribosomal protein S18 acetylase RimI-like enzyme